MEAFNEKNNAVLMLALCLMTSFCGDDKKDTDVKAPTSDNEENNDYSTEGDIKVDLSDATLDIPEDPMYDEMFVEGRLLFYVATPSTAASFREYDINFGIIPLPKLDKNQERYGSWVDP